MKKGFLKIAIVVVLIIGASAIAYVLMNSKPEAKKSPKAVRTLSVKAFTETPSDFDLTIDYSAKVVSQDMVALGVEVGGKIERGNVPLKTGQEFRKGALLFSINNDDITAKLISSKSKFITLLSQALPDIKIDFSEQFGKWESFFDAISLEKPMPEIPKTLSSKEKVYMASKGLISAYYDIISQELLATKHNIYAPFNGVFTSITKEVGAIVGANSQIGTISATDNLDIVASVSQTESSRIKVGEPAIVHSRGGEEFRGKVTRISSFVDEKTKMVDVYINLYEPSRAIIEGEMVDVTIPIGSVKNVIRIPVDAVANNNRIYGVDGENKIFFITAKVEYEQGEWAYISGTKEDVRIVQESIITPIEGMTVNVIEKHID